MQNSLVEGVVVDTSDPQQMGRVKCWCPALDGQNYIVDDLPWATYISPLAGQTVDYPGGPNSAAAPGFTSYGFWAIPKVGATVIIGFLYGDRNQRFYLGSFYPEHGNRSLPAGRNASIGPSTDVDEAIQPTVSHLNDQFQGNLAAPEAQSRGAYERQVAQPKTDKDGFEGYQKGVRESGFDPQTYCLTTPGRHSLIFQDNPATGRVRIKTSSGHQIILDDANERIYISTARGASWFEMDQDGRVHLFANDSISVSCGGDFNLGAVGNINIQAGGNLNLSTSGYLRASACSDISLSSDADTNIGAGAALNLLASAAIVATGATIDLNGPGAAAAPCADKAVNLPSYEPWTRAASKIARGKNWKA